MILKDRVNCTRLVLTILHIAMGVKCCTVHSNSPSLLQLRQIELSLNHTVDPCDDFYAHACDNWPELHTDLNYDEVTGLVDYKVNKRLINIVESAYQHPFQVTDHCQSFVEKTRIYYKSCLAERVRNINRYFEDIKPSETLEWPLAEVLQTYTRNGGNLKLEEWPSHELDVFALLGKLQSYGFNNILIGQEIARTKNGSLQIMLELPSVSADDELPPHVIMVLLVKWGLPEFLAAKYATKIVKTQEAWHNIYENYSQTVADENGNLDKLSYAELKDQYPPLFTYLEHMLPQQIRPDDYVVLANLDYFHFLLNNPRVLQNQENLTNYLMMTFLAYLLQDSAKEFTPLDCIEDLRKKMDLAVNYLYYEHIYQVLSLSYNDEITDLSTKIGKYFMETLSENYLNFSSQQLKQIQDKLLPLTVNVGNLPENLQISQVEEFYKDVPALELQNYYKNHLDLLRHRFQKSLLYIDDQSFFSASDNRVGSSSSPIYIPKQHLVILHLGFLQPPIYHHTYQPLFIWSMLGFLLAHEFTHAIDTMGLQYGDDDVTSIFENSNFSAALECMQTQQPTDSIDERLADLMGARVAYKAYVNEYEQWQLQPRFTKIPWKKLFFLNMAQFFCGRKGVDFVDHDADAVRLREIVKNSEAFAEAFNCPKGSPMHPELKCRLY